MTPRLFTAFADFYISVAICRLYRKLEIGERGKEARCPCLFYSILLFPNLRDPKILENYHPEYIPFP